MAGGNLGSEPSNGWRFSALKFGSLALLIPFLWLFGDFQAILTKICKENMIFALVPELSNLESWDLILAKIYGISQKRKAWRKIGDLEGNLAKIWQFYCNFGENLAISK